jgi:large subunit ribosomal protein L43
VLLRCVCPYPVAALHTILFDHDHDHFLPKPRKINTVHYRLLLNMATRGVFQLTKLHLYYCEHGGSSRAIRDYLTNGRLMAWAREHPCVDIEIKVRNGKHPYVQGEYKTSSPSLHQISVKNVDSWRQIEEVCKLLHDRTGRKITKITTPVLTDTPSIQGVWTPFLNLTDEKFPIKFIE